MIPAALRHQTYGGCCWPAAFAIHPATPQDSGQLTSAWDGHIATTEIAPCHVINECGTELQALEIDISVTFQLNE